MRQNRNSRCSSDRQKDIHLTEGALHFYELEKEKSRGRPAAEVIVVAGNEPSSRIVSQGSEGPNIYRPENFNGIHG